MFNWIKTQTAGPATAILLGALLMTACGPTSGSYRPAQPLVYGVAPTLYSVATRPRGGSATPNPDMLIGLDMSELETLLGAADLRRRDPPAQVWRYADKDCVLHLFLYENDGGYTVEHYEARDHNGAEGTGGVCLAGLMNGGRHRSTN